MDRTTRERRPAVATTLDMADAMIAAKTRAQAPIRRSPRLSAGTSSTRLSYRGIDRQRTSQKNSEKMNPRLWLKDYRLACQAGEADSDYFIIRKPPLVLG
jgi:hypothetical protein